MGNDGRTYQVTITGDLVPFVYTYSKLVVLFFGCCCGFFVCVCFFLVVFIFVEGVLGWFWGLFGCSCGCGLSWNKQLRIFLAASMMLRRLLGQGLLGRSSRRHRREFPWDDSSLMWRLCAAGSV